MSRSGYDMDCDPDYDWQWILPLGARARALNGKRGQAFLRELVAALDAMPEKCLIRDDLIQEGGSVCAIGSVGVQRGIDMSGLNSYDPYSVAAAFGISKTLVSEIEYENDNALGDVTPEYRWRHVRDWAVGNIKEPKD